MWFKSIIPINVSWEPLYFDCFSEKPRELRLAAYIWFISEYFQEKIRKILFLRTRVIFIVLEFHWIIKSRCVIFKFMAWNLSRIILCFIIREKKRPIDKRRPQRIWTRIFLMWHHCTVGKTLIAKVKMTNMTREHCCTLEGGKSRAEISCFFLVLAICLNSTPQRTNFC